MPNYEVFKRPTVKKVIFQIRFPNMFKIENKIGEIQDKIIEKFPESKYQARKKFLIADVSSEVKDFKIPQLGEDDPQTTTKIWSFSTEKDNPRKYILNILTNSLDLTSETHKSYHKNVSTSEEGFRDIITFVTDAFFSVIPIYKIKRLGLRYIDECPIPPSIEKVEFRKWYNTVLPIDRFELKDVIQSYFTTDIKKGENRLIFQEGFGKNDKKEDVYNLDFDGYRENIESERLIAVLDELHALIHQEWEHSIKQPVYDWMRINGT